MQKKKLIVKFAKDIRKNTNRTFVESIKLSKAFYKNKTSIDYGVEGFAYDYDPEYSRRGYSYEECLFFNGKIENKDGNGQWEIPIKFYNIKDEWFNKRR